VTPMTTERPDAAYTARAIKATGLIDETRVLLRAWRPGETSSDLRRRALDEGLLGRATASRTEDLVTEAFRHRFLSGPAPAAPHLRRLLEARGFGPWFVQLCLLYTARADVVLREAITVYAAQRRTNGRRFVDTPSFVLFLEEQEARGRMARPWSKTVKASVAQHVLRQMTDFGVAGPSRRGVRQITPFAPGNIAVAWLAYDLHFQGLTDSDVVGHDDWRLWSVEEPEVRARMAELAQPELWEFQAAGSVVRVTWSCSSMNEVIDGIARYELQ
jgi:hypothetical protein